MLPRVMQQAGHVMVVERVERETAGAPDADETFGSQQPELVRDRGFGDADQRREVRDAPLAVRQRVHEPHARGIAEQFKDGGHRFHRSVAQKSRADV